MGLRRKSIARHYAFTSGSHCTSRPLRLVVFRLPTASNHAVGRFVLRIIPELIVIVGNLSGKMRIFHWVKGHSMFRDVGFL